ncbi:nuclear transport factor 2 family protein [Dyadobacter aurulentus]|uniref:nuclear transport factor 2 family protein n=1 Tax=Dyadobacter sp. UC 10 TaxID=2605428 RepID=UPI0011F16881|nr:nuclear transport factor 2 family protein [Dyadobacter sp. UC 10]KAA0990614.1 nuclear transport factor 2 family protein [Dyadobacter sp. UC 10]
MREATYTYPDMKFILLFLIQFSIAFAAKAQFAQPIDGTDCARQFFNALQEKNVDALEDILAADFTVVSFNGQTINREQLIQSLSDRLLVIESGMQSGINTRNYRDVAIVTGLWSIRARLQNNSFQGDLSFMAVCTRNGAKWQVSAVQLTPVQ